MKINATAKGIIPGHKNDCLSIGGECYVTKLPVRQLSSASAVGGIEIDDTQEQASIPCYLLVFNVSFTRHQVSHVWSYEIVPKVAKLIVTLENDFIAKDGAPEMESEKQALKLKYKHGVKQTESEKLEAKLSIEEIASAGGSSGSQLSDEYAVLVATEASIEHCTIQLRNKYGNSPEWIFRKRLNKPFLEATRNVWLLAQQHSKADSASFAGKVTLKAWFTRVVELENPQLTPTQMKLYKHVKGIRPWFESANMKKEIALTFNF